MMLPIQAYHKALTKLTGYGENNLSWTECIREALVRLDELEKRYGDDKEKVAEEEV